MKDLISVSLVSATLGFGMLCSILSLLTPAFFALHKNIQSTLSNSSSLGDRKKMFELQMVRASETRIIEDFCWEISKGPENCVRSSKISNDTSSNWTQLTVHAYA